jgi:hypothetical protein
MEDFDLFAYHNFEKLSQNLPIQFTILRISIPTLVNCRDIMFQYSILHLTDGRYGIQVGQVLLATVGSLDQATAILHRLTQKQLQRSVASLQSSSGSRASESRASESRSGKRQKLKAV